jgi:ribonuclease inhibitor
MSVKKYVLDGRGILSLSDFYNEITRVLPLPGYFGRNLDALADSLLTDIEGPLEIAWEYSSSSREAMKEDYSKIAALLKRIVRERRDCKVTFL